MATKDSEMLPRQEWDEINVSHSRVKTPQKMEVTMKLPKNVEKMLKNLKKGKKKNGR